MIYKANIPKVVINGYLTIFDTDIIHVQPFKFYNLHIYFTINDDKYVYQMSVKDFKQFFIKV